MQVAIDEALLQTMSNSNSRSDLQFNVKFIKPIGPREDYGDFIKRDKINDFLGIIIVCIVFPLCFFPIMNLAIGTIAFEKRLKLISPIRRFV